MCPQLNIWLKIYNSFQTKCSLHWEACFRIRFNTIVSCLDGSTKQFFKIKTFLKSDGDRQWRAKACTAVTETFFKKVNTNFVAKVYTLADFKYSFCFDKTTIKACLDTFMNHTCTTTNSNQNSSSKPAPRVLNLVRTCVCLFVYHHIGLHQNLCHTSTVNTSNFIFKVGLFNLDFW